MSQERPVRISFPALQDERVPVHKIAERLEPYLVRLVETIHPERVILFGSQASGAPTKHSDVDLLIVRPAQGTMLQANLEVRRAFRGVNADPLSFTIISITGDRLKDKVESNDEFFGDILRTGVELYAA
jgi:predicted nucleotidyltransferase